MVFGVRSLGPWAVAQTPRLLSAAAAARCRQAYAQEKLTLLNKACEVDLRRRGGAVMGPPRRLKWRGLVAVSLTYP